VAIAKDAVKDGRIAIHNLIEIKFDETFPWRDEWIETIADVIHFTDGESGAPAARLLVRYKKTLDSSGMRQLEEDVYIGERSLLDLKYGVLLQSEADKTLVLTTNNLCLEWFSLATQLTLLAAGATLVHCAAIEKDGAALIFPSWGGTGKTALITEFITNKGWRLLGDDLVILMPDGTCYGFPKHMVLYPYHKDLFVDIFSNGHGPIAPTAFNSLLAKAGKAVKPLLRPFPRLLRFARLHNPQSIRINPSEVFGVDKLAQKAQLEVVVWLERIEGDTKPELRPAGDMLQSMIMGSSLNEYDPWCVRLVHIAMGTGIIDCRYFYPAWEQIIQSSLQGCKQYVLNVSTSVPVSELPRVVRDLLSEHRVLAAL